MEHLPNNCKALYSVYMQGFSYIQNQFVLAGDATVPVTSRGFRYGDGAFSTIAVTRGKMYQFAWHMADLKASLQTLSIDHNVHALLPLCTELIARNALIEGFVRIYVSRGGDNAGYLPQAENAALLVIETLPAAPYAPQPLTLWVSSVEKPSSKALPTHAKTAQGLNSTLARLDAAAHQCDEALQLNAKNQICEASGANIFWRKRGSIFTPAALCGLYGGSTRAALLRLRQDIIEGEYSVRDLEDAEAVILTNVRMLAAPVNSLKPLNLYWRSESLAEEMRALLIKDRQAA